MLSVCISTSRYIFNPACRVGRHSDGLEVIGPDVGGAGTNVALCSVSSEERGKQRYLIAFITASRVGGENLHYT